MSHIFISYSHKDMDYAYKLADALQTKGFDVWIDARLDYGSQWPHEIQKQLDACGAFILVMSPRSFASEWVQSELQRAKRKLKPIFPILLEGEEPWLSVESTQFYDVRGEKFPDTAFYSTLKRVLAVNDTASTLRLPKQLVKATLVANSPQFRFKTMTTIGTIAAILIVCTGIFAGALGLTSIISNTGKNLAAPQTVIFQVTQTPGVMRTTPQEIIPSPMAISTAMTLLELEPLLNQANISISTGSPTDLARVRTYFISPTSAYQLLAVASLQVVDGKHFTKTAYLDMIDKWYAILAGKENYVSSNGELDLEKLKEAMTKAHNEYYGDDVLLLDQILESN
jgi:hypothetical protein